MKAMIFASLLLVNSFITISQHEKNISNEKLQLGFNLGVNYSNVLSDATLLNGTSISNKRGFKLGVLAEYKLNRFLLISPKTELSFNNGRINFNNSSIHSYQIMPVSIDFMTHFQFNISSKKWCPYILIGPNIKIPLSGNNNSSTEFTTNSDFAIDFGIGLNKKTSFINFSPELRYSYGLLNISRHPSIENLSFHTISLVLNIVGQ